MTSRKTALIATGLAALILAGAGAGLWLYLGRDVDDEATEQARDDTLQIAGARIAIENRFPEAQVTFGKTFVHWEGEVPSVCGRVDVVEEQDSFDGEERYVFSEGGLTVEEVDGTDALTQKWADVCQ